MSLPGHIALSSRLRAALTPVASVAVSSRPALDAQRSQAIILGSFVGFQALDFFTTHLGLALQHQELNQFMAPIIDTQGELTAYAVKGTAIAVLLAILMLTYRRKPRVWQVYLIAGWLSAVAVIANVVQLLL
jgi:hypothetical protein